IEGNDLLTTEGPTPRGREDPRFGWMARVESGVAAGGVGLPAVTASFPSPGGPAMPGRFGRVLTAMATPFSPDGNLDVDGAQRLARHLLDNGTDTLVVAGTSTYSTAESVELTHLAEKAGAGSLLLVTPYYNKPPQSGLVAHFSAIAASTGLPCMLYNIPGRTACTIEVPTMLRLFEQLDNVVAVKDAVGDMAAASR